MLEVEKLYVCEQYHLMLYPDKETAVASRLTLTERARAASAFATGTAGEAAYWSDQLGKAVSYVDKNIPLLVLNDKKRYIKVLVGDKKGWIIYADWLELKEFC